MATTDPRIDAYIAKSADFARPILAHLREIVHAACPEVEETLKWSAPHFLYKGMLCGMAAFKQHCVFGFWKGKLIVADDGRDLDAAMGQFGRLAKIADLPQRKTLIAYVKKAVALNEASVKSPARVRTAAPRPPAAVPDDLAAALKKNAKARATFEAFSPSGRREYIEWITDAKREATRTQRLATTLEWLAQGKQRNWKYMNC
ncbi:YdeI/OmpD-associated family protein [Dokdonella soli]|uniref:YdhG-like domain-containing protein n=1 Tax=Dokdonella soli TaxID=529810 RepID=A0ABN1IEA3_9GAMM